MKSKIIANISEAKELDGTDKIKVEEKEASKAAIEKRHKSTIIESDQCLLPNKLSTKSQSRWSKPGNLHNSTKSQELLSIQDFKSS
jgi:phage repressor protein C with HTH and peptisase S24 domain